ncbi:MAG: glycoside hydrolase family 2 TIM barrel-domain containing protein [Microthrixaceae bacterium]
MARCRAAGEVTGADLPDTPLFDADDRFWEDPALTSRNRLRSRPLVASHASAVEARHAPALWQAVEGSPWALSLDGTWQFLHFPEPEAVPCAAVQAGGGPGADIEVPGAWTLQGWDSPIYTNVQMPFAGEAPRVPARNPTGVYRRSIEVPAEWAGRDVILTLGGTESLAVVYVDGRFVGLATDSRLASEFDLTSFVTAGGSHVVAVVAIRWTAATWIEDQDQWWHGGIQGSVALWSRPVVHLAEVGLVPGLDADGTTGMLDVDIAVGGALAGAPPTRWWVGVEVEQLDGAGVAAFEPVEVTAFDDSDALARLLASSTWPGPVVSKRLKVPDVEAWSDERPARYRALVRLWSGDPEADPTDGADLGEPVEVAAVLTGFRSVAVGGRELRINGAAPLIRGMNRHEHDPRRGRFVDPDGTWAELCLAKRLNVNAIRTAHAPAAPWFYDMCSELGLYVVDETNVESHARQAALLAGPDFTGSVIERGLRMVGRDRNHPCVIVWSLGNEAGEGAAHHGLAGAIRHVDPSRPLSYEGPIMFDLAADNPVSDLVAPMYRSVEEITHWATSRTDRRRPLILCEYSHAMGNSNGGLDDYWRAFRAYDGLQGGFVWEWRDHGLVRPSAPGRPVGAAEPAAEPATRPGGAGVATRWGYGGDFGEVRHDGNFVCDGLLATDLTPHPASIELAHLQRSLHVEGVDVRRGRVRLRNERSFTDTSDLVGAWQVLADGVEVAAGRFAVPVVPPGGEATVNVPLPSRELSRWEPGELVLGVTLASARDTAWAPAGHVVAHEQLAMPPAATPQRRPPVRAATTEVSIERVASDRWELGDGAWCIEVDRHDGVAGLAHLGRQVLVARPGHSLWRAPVDNDGMKTGWMAGFGHQARWRRQGLHSVDGPEARRLDRVTVRRRDGGAVAVLTGALVPQPAGGEQARPPECPVTERWWLRNDGTIAVDVRWDLPDELADPPRVGLLLAIDPALDRLDSYGLGPHECPPDRVAGAVLGRHRRSASRERCPYVVPQCFGQRSGTRWLAAGSPEAGSLVITGSQPFVHTAHRYSEAQLTEALHADELELDDGLFVHLDAAHRGVGTASCGPDAAARHRIAAGRHRLGLELSWEAPEGDR